MISTTFLFDTNVLSELMWPAPEPRVVRFVAEFEGPFVSAARAASVSAVLATRNTRHFERLGIDLVNPWNN